MSETRSRDSQDGSGDGEEHREEIEAYGRILALLTRRKVMVPSEAEEFRSWAMVRFLEDDCAVLRGFQGKSSLATYLRVVANNALRDYRIAAWGKWRPSAAARRAGDVAVRLEQLVYRDGVPPTEAYRSLRENHGIELSESELEELLGRLPRRFGRERPVDVEPDRLVGVSPGSEAAVIQGERERIAERLSEALAEELGGLDQQDRMLLRLRFEEGLSVARISRSLGLEQKPLYRRYDRLLRGLRDRLESHGCGTEEVRRVWSWHGLDLGFSESGNSPEGSV